MSVAINAFLERFDADALHHVDEALGFAVAVLQIVSMRRSMTSGMSARANAGPMILPRAPGA